MMNKRARYAKNKEANVGDACICPSCNTEFVKDVYQQKFCKSKGGTVCKDKYWNSIILAKKNNTTRISPANAAWKKKRKNKSIYSDMHPYEGLNDEDYKNF